jgi:hypothetical protein
MRVGLVFDFFLFPSLSLGGILCPYTLPKRRRSGFKVLEGYTDTKYLGHIWGTALKNTARGKSEN